MSTPTHELHFNRLELSAAPRHLAAGLRVLFVASGSVALSSGSGDWPQVLEADQAALGRAAVDLRATGEEATVLSWSLGAPSSGDQESDLWASLDLHPDRSHLVRCDRVDFPPGGEALLHTHQGPGIRCLLKGELAVTVDGHTKQLEPLDPWFESGPEPVYAAASETEPTAFVRVMVLPSSLLGESSIRYVRPEDRAKPKSQRYTVYLDEAVTLPIRGPTS